MKTLVGQCSFWMKGTDVDLKWPYQLTVVGHHVAA